VFDAADVTNNGKLTVDEFLLFCEKATNIQKGEK